MSSQRLKTMAQAVGKKKKKKKSPPTLKEISCDVVLIGPTIHSAESGFFTIHACRQTKFAYIQSLRR